MTAEEFDTTVDVLVIGSGGGGMTAALTADAAGLDVLVVENCILYRHEQPNADSFDAEAYKKQFELD